ncbi:MAG: methionyl-tRNA formyltransferase [Pseudomonadota bacterium]
MRLVFMGSPDFSVRALEAICDTSHEIVCVYTQPPRPAGRGKADRVTPVHAFAEQRGWPVRTPKSLKKEPEQNEFASLNADLAIVVAYGLILPQPILDAPRLGCVNLHASLLPRWRGAAPIQRAIMAGDRETGVQAMVMEAGLDTGPVLATARTEIAKTDTAGTLHDRLAELGADLLPDVVDRLGDGTLKAVPQTEDGVTYASKLGPDDQLIDWSRPADEIDCQIRGLSPFPGAYANWIPPGSETAIRLKLLMSEVEHGDGDPGTLLDDRLLVACGKGALRLTKLQKPGKSAMAAQDFLRGTHLPKGDQLA